MLKPEHKFHSHVTATTVGIMYFVVQHAVPQIQRAVPLLATQPELKKIFLPAVALLMSASIYKILASLLLGAIRKLKVVKKFYLGANYICGTWVGNFRASDGATVHSVEHFEQTLSSMKVRGEARYDDGRSYARWHSLAEMIDENNGVLIYTYNCDPTSEKASFQGVGVFHFDRPDESSAPTGLNGYSADLIDGARTENRELKVSEDSLKFEAALEKAREMKEKTKVTTS